MAQRSNGIELAGVKAGADLSADQYKLVKFDTNGDVVLAGAGDRVIGVLQNKPVSGAAAVVIASGGALAKCGGTVAVGRYVTSDNNGLLKVSDTDNAPNLGMSLDAGVANDIVEVFVSLGVYATA